MKMAKSNAYAGDSGIIMKLRLQGLLLNLIPIPLNYYPLLRGKIRQRGVALNQAPN